MPKSKRVADIVHCKACTGAFRQHGSEGAFGAEFIGEHPRAADVQPVMAGLMKWFQDRLPLTEEGAEELEEAEHTLHAAFAGIGEAKRLVDLLGPARRHAMGDRKALLALPVEIRRLVT